MSGEERKMIEAQLNWLRTWRPCAVIPQGVADTLKAEGFDLSGLWVSTPVPTR